MAEAKRVSTCIVLSLAPKEMDILGFYEQLAQQEFKMPPRDPWHAFGIEDTLPYALIICSLIGGVFLGAIKDVAKDRIAGLLKRWIDGTKEEALSDTEINQIINDLRKTGGDLNVPSRELQQVTRDIKKLLRNYPSACLLRSTRQS
ncbi:MAG: hypothetical protein GY839_10205 [candidate division Zixibacteria bacterium]|nr:hypothetical protein [candidate division Zixibacteria bacterium]